MILTAYQRSRVLMMDHQCSCEFIDLVLEVVLNVFRDGVLAVDLAVKGWFNVVFNVTFVVFVYDTGNINI